MNKVYLIDLEAKELPKFFEKKYQDWVSYGNDNKFPEYLFNLYNKSSLHHAIIDSKIDYTIGGGITYTDKENTKTEGLLEDVYDGEDFNTFFRKIVTDYVLTGIYYFSVLPSVDGGVCYKHYPVKKIRIGKKDSKGKITSFLYSENWNRWRSGEYAPVEIPAYGTVSANKEQMVYFNMYNPECDYYTYPSYAGALASIQIDINIDDFHLANLENGMTPGYMISYFDIPEGDERADIVKQFREKNTGAQKAGKYLVTFASDKDKAPTITTISATDLDKQFDLLNKTILQKILAGHGIVSPMLVGIKTEGQLGGANELQNSFTIFYKTRIEPIQKDCLKEINKINKKNGYSELEIIKSNPVEFTWSENILKEILTEDEMRNMIGLDPKDKNNII